MSAIDTIHAVPRWSWRQLLAEAEGDEEIALRRLADMSGIGEYEDDVHRRAPGRAHPARAEQPESAGAAS